MAGRLYTRSGDDGTTGLFGGGRVRKDHPRVQAYGTVDELNASIGLCICALNTPSTDPNPPAASDDLGGLLGPMLTQLQSRLFDLGADLATPLDSQHAEKVVRMDARHITQAEQWIDMVDADNAPMTQFILPGGSELSARLHMARTIARRAERWLVTAQQVCVINSATIVYLNRISDLLFAMARRANRALGVADVAWQKDFQGP
jgi:cob(I)alamin adenosyltransferase